jgi:hypothetical protein
MKDWNEIKLAVEKAGNVLTVSMEDLRNVHGAAKLGINVRTEISSTLAGMGLGHVPTDLPPWQHESVRLYKRGTPVGDFIQTVLTPGTQNDSSLVAKFAGDETNYLGIIEQIRELVAE